MNCLAMGNCPDPPVTSCAVNDACDKHLVRLCANGPSVGRACTSSGDCAGFPCRDSWQEHFIDAGEDQACATSGFGDSGADGVDIRDFDGDGDFDIVTGWEESGITYIYVNPCNPPDPNNPTSCSNPGATQQQWRVPWGPNPMDVRGGVGTENIEDAAFADFDSAGQPEGVVTATEGGNQHIKLHGKTHLGTWLGATLPGEKNAYMQVRAADINGDGCADIVAGSKLLLPGCYNPTPIGPQGCAPCNVAGIACADVGALWWWECPKVSGVCSPFGPNFHANPPQIDVSGWNKRRIDDGFYWIMGIELTDMDGDGDKDVLYSDRFEVGWFENRTSPAQGGNLAGWGTPIRIDTVQDILARKDGTDFSSGEPFRFLAYDDVDGDNLKDVVVTASFKKGFCSASSNIVCATTAECPGGEVCNNNGDHFSGYFYRRLTTNGQSWQINPILVKGGVPNSLDAECDAVSKGVAIGDVTGDGRKDLVFSVRGAGHVLYSLSYDPAPPGQCGPCVNNQWNARPIAPCRSVSKYDNVQLADIDRDGLLDVVSTEENFPGLPGQSGGLGVVWFRNLGYCGNGRIDADEECDNGASNGTAGQCCDTSCRVTVQQICRASTGQCDTPEYCALGSGACPPDARQPPGTPCSMGQCDALPHECNGSGTCIVNTQGAQPCTINSQCATGLCITGFCAASCPDDGNPCTNDVCNGGLCQHPSKAPGTACPDTDGNACTVSLCNAGSQCVAQPVAAGNHCGLFPAAPCDDFDLCDGAGNCLPKVRAAGTICRASEGVCDFAETCNGVSTSCPPDLFLPVGTTCGTPPAQSCNADQSICFGYCSAKGCDVGRDCTDMPYPAGTVCFDDGNECSQHTCSSTFCVRSSVPGPCTDDGNVCTLDFCNGTSCFHPPDPLADLCPDDGNPCTDDLCVDGACAHVIVPGRACADDGNECTENVCGADGNCYPPVTDGGACTDDGSLCTNDICIAGACTHPPVADSTPCADDGNECTNDVCVAGQCVYLPLWGQPCTDDGNECTADLCSVTGLCAHPPVADQTPCTSDGNVCTKDHCLSGICAHPPEAAGLVCGNPTADECDAPDSCDGAGACAANHVANQTPCTPDQLDCTVDECRNGICVHASELPISNKGDALCGGLSISPVGNPPNDIIRAFAVFDDGNGAALYAGGTMLHKWDGATWTQIPTPIADTILAMQVADLPDFGDGPALYIGGRLASPLNGPQPLRRWDGTTWTDLGPFNGPVHAMAELGTLYVGGAFTTVDFTLPNGTPMNGFVVNHVAKISFLDPPIWEALGSGTDDVVYALAHGLYSSSPFDLLGVGGAFTAAGGQSATGFAMWDFKASGDSGWSVAAPLLPPTGGTLPEVHTIAAFSFNDFLSPFHIGGLFRAPASGSPTGFSTNIARLLGIGEDWFELGQQGVTSASLDAVRSIVPHVDVAGPATFIGGSFGSFDNFVTPQLVRWGGLPYSLGSCLNGSVEAMISFDDGSGPALYIGGQFTDSNASHYVARWKGVLGDINSDGVVSGADYTTGTDEISAMNACHLGPDVPAPSDCSCSDLNADSRVDMRDVAELVNLIPPSP